MQSTKPLLIVSTEKCLTNEMRERLSECLDALGEKTGYHVTMFDSGFKAETDSSHAVLELLTVIADNQARTNDLLASLVEALADERDPDQEPRTYLNGQSVS